MGQCSLGQCSSASISVRPPTPPKRFKKRTIPKSLKKLVWDTWVGENIGVVKCLCCGHQNIRQIEFHCGHVKAEQKGGELTVENLRPICAQCNLSMGTMNMMEFQQHYFSIVETKYGKK
jgi:hypothetical protein